MEKEKYEKPENEVINLLDAEILCGKSGEEDHDVDPFTFNPWK